MEISSTAVDAPVARPSLRPPPDSRYSTTPSTMNQRQPAVVLSDWPSFQSRCGAMQTGAPEASGSPASDGASLTRAPRAHAP